MQSNFPDISLPAALVNARVDAISHSLAYSGRISPQAASDLASRGEALLVAPLVHSVLEDSEGDLDDSGQRGRQNGWRAQGLPWVQD